MQSLQLIMCVHVQELRRLRTACNSLRRLTSAAAASAPRGLQLLLCLWLLPPATYRCCDQFTAIHAAVDPIKIGSRLHPLLDCLL